MPTRKTATPPDDDDDIIQAPPPPAPSDLEPDSPPSLADRIRAMSSTDDIDRVKVKVYRRIPGRTTLEWCADYSVPDYEQGELAMLRDDWGPGDYQIRVYSAGRGIMLRDDIRVAASLRRPNPAPEPAPAPGHSELSDVVRMLAEGQQRILEALGQRPDPTAQLQQTLGLMGAMREAMGLHQAPPPAADPMQMLGQMVATMKTLREVAQEVAPPPVDTDNPMSMLPQVLDLVKAGMGGQQQPPPELLAPPEPVQPLQVPGTFATTDGDDDVKMPNLGMLALRGQLSQLVKMAQAGDDPKKGGLFVAEHLPDELLPALRSASYFELLTPFYGGISAHRAWFDAARAEALRLLDAQDSGPSFGGTD